jgi:hypothetical protein
MSWGCGGAFAVALSIARCCPRETVTTDWPNIILAVAKSSAVETLIHFDSVAGKAPEIIPPNELNDVGGTLVKRDHTSPYST